jgi:hypothetical protein
MIPGTGGTAAAIQPPGGQLCAMFGCDIAGFTRPGRNEEIQFHLRRALYDMLGDAFRASGIPWEQCEHYNQGDGTLIIAPPGISAQAMIDPLPGRLAGLIARHNRIVREPSCLQLRAAVSTGIVYHDDQGIAGNDVTLLCRMLDAGDLRRLLASSGADLALIVPAHLYDTLIRQQPSLIDPASFRPLNTTVKRTRIRARVCLLGTPGAPP